MQRFWAPGCRRGGWLFFPSQLQPGEQGTAVARLTIGPSCDASTTYGEAWTYWLYDAALTDLGLGPLPTVWSQHYDTARPFDGDPRVSMERFAFQFTAGPVLWEAWATPERCAERGLPCGADRPRMDINGRTFVLVDQRIWSRPIALAVPASGAALKLMAGDAE